jgi:molybdenum cofactor synthesis domain-containing protein
MGGREDISAAIVIIGDEVLSGRTRDENINFMARQLAASGIILAEVRIVSDNMERIAKAVNELRGEHDYVFTTGGIGPTHDDITAEAVAAALGVSLKMNEQAARLLREGHDLTGPDDERLRMARIPEGARLIVNPVSPAPGFMLENVAVMAGVPRIMRAMLLELLPSLRHGEPVHSQSLRVMAPESRISRLLRELQAEHEDVAIGSYPFVENGVMGAELVLRSRDREAVNRTADKLADALRAKGLEPEMGE